LARVAEVKPPQRVEPRLAVVVEVAIGIQATAVVVAMMAR